MSSDSPDQTPPSLDYRAAGVDIDAGAALVERIKPLAAATHRPGVMAGLGGFGALFELPLERYRQPVLVSGTDGVGTKLRLAIELDRHDGIGIDLVAMCANDILVSGAEPLFFLDYYATARLDVEVAARVVSGIAEGCRQAGCALAGGETAEMPGMYASGDYDLAGFCVGIVEKDALIQPQQVAVDDVLIALPSSGPHANGYSLIRKVIEVTGADLAQPLAGDTVHQTLGEALLAPTRIYVNSVLALTRMFDVHALSHITGGGITDNLPRVLPDGVRAMIDLDAWQRPGVFDWIQNRGAIAEADMLRTFNCGIGMLICVAPNVAAGALSQLQAAGEQPWIVGHIARGEGAPTVIYRRNGINA